MEGHAALLVVDVQTEYMIPEPFLTSDGDDLVAKCCGLIERARAAGVPVVYVRHLDEDPPADPAAANICPEIAPRRGEPVVEKRFPSAFFRTDLERILKKLRVRALYACGLATFGCLNTTVMCALCKGYDVTVVHDAHGAQALGETSAAQVIAQFEAAWAKAGAVLERARAIDFQR
ncbi:MAG: isochorismatase family protein [Candidatus Bipolaricaulota bacterium]|nr:isochorismatase family protein [Candidatus Bipolaricaulota bacterium]